MIIRELLPFVHKAREFAILKHGDQKYSLGSPYVVHLDEVAAFFSNERTLQAAAYLHDTVEDTNTSVNEIRDLFGWSVAHYVNLMTKEPQEPNRPYLDRIAQDDGARRLKLADISVNMSHCIREADIDFDAASDAQIDEAKKRFEMAQRYVTYFRYLTTGEWIK